jgi:hypothetical protein
MGLVRKDRRLQDDTELKVRETPSHLQLCPLLNVPPIPVRCTMPISHETQAMATVLSQGCILPIILLPIENVSERCAQSMEMNTHQSLRS